MLEPELNITDYIKFMDIQYEKEKGQWRKSRAPDDSSTETRRTHLYRFCRKLALLIRKTDYNKPVVL